MISAEIRLFFKNRIDWDIEYFTATCPTDLYNKAVKIAEQRHADHFNCGQATEQGSKPMEDIRLARRVIPASSIKDQVELIEKAIGKTER